MVREKVSNEWANRDGSQGKNMTKSAKEGSVQTPKGSFRKKLTDSLAEFTERRREQIRD